MTTITWDTSTQDGFQTEVARSYLLGYTGMDDPYAFYIKKGRRWLRRAGFAGIVGNDIPFLVYLLWWDAGEAFRKHGEVSCIVAGNVSDQITDDEAALICQIEPSLVIPTEGVGSCSPQVTAILDVLEAVGSCMEDAWLERDDV